MRLADLPPVPVILMIRFYQKALSQTVARRMRCRFYPSCSEYAIMAIHRYGVVRGLTKAFDRVRRCRPDNLESCIDYP